VASMSEVEMKATLARLKGATRAFVSEPDQVRRDAAERFGADIIVIDPTSTDEGGHSKPTDSRSADVVVRRSAASGCTRTR
jgi:threonine dehydrogenase-like Zn-dependent dehydrogenase